MTFADSAEKPFSAAWRKDATVLEQAEARQMVISSYDSHHLALRRYLISLGLSLEESQEAVQEAFLRLHQHLLADGDRTNLRAWVFRVAHNFARNEQSRAGRRFVSSMEENAASLSLTDSGISPEEHCLDREKQRRIAGALQALTPLQRECLLLRAQGLRYREIAEILQIGVSSVAEHVQRGVRRMKESL